jgi:hypothetical protein
MKELLPKEVKRLLKINKKFVNKNSKNRFLAGISLNYTDTGIFTVSSNGKYLFIGYSNENVHLGQEKISATLPRDLYETILKNKVESITIDKNKCNVKYYDSSYETMNVLKSMDYNHFMEFGTEETYVNYQTFINEAETYRRKSGTNKVLNIPVKSLLASLALIEESQYKDLSNQSPNALKICVNGQWEGLKAKFNIDVIEETKNSVYLDIHFMQKLIREIDEDTVNFYWCKREGPFIITDRFDRVRVVIMPLQHSTVKESPIDQTVLTRDYILEKFDSFQKNQIKFCEVYGSCDLTDKQAATLSYYIRTDCFLGVTRENENEKYQPCVKVNKRICVISNDGSLTSVKKDNLLEYKNI